MAGQDVLGKGRLQTVLWGEGAVGREEVFCGLVMGKPGRRMWTHKGFSVFSLPWGRPGWQEGPELGIRAPGSVRLWLTGFPRGQSLLRGGCSGEFKTGYFLSPCQKPEGTFPHILWRNLVDLLEVNLTAPCGLLEPSARGCCPQRGLLKPPATTC